MGINNSAYVPLTTVSFYLIFLANVVDLDKVVLKKILCDKLSARIKNKLYIFISMLVKMACVQCIIEKYES